MAGRRVVGRCVIAVAVVAVAVRGLGGFGPFAAGDRSASELSVPPKPADTGGQWRFMDKDGDRPVAFDPCHTIHYVVRVGGGPLNGVALVQEGLRLLSEATGLTFAFDGMTDEVPGLQRRPYRADLWIGWADRTETDFWSVHPDAVGVGGSAIGLSARGNRVRTWGYAVLLPDNGLPPTFAQGETEGQVLLHELGHVAGLHHVEDAFQTMHYGVTRFAGGGYGDGDRRGLWELGASRGCL